MAQQGGLGPEFCKFRTGDCKIPLFHGVGDGLGAGGSAGAGAPKPVCRAAAAPKLLKMATPIPNWSNVMGPIDTAMQPPPPYLCEDTIGLRCLVMTSATGSLQESMERG